MLPTTRPRGLWLLPVLLLTASARAEEPASRGPEDRKLDAIFREYLDGLFARQPLTATRLGDHRSDRRLEDLSPESRRDGLEFRRTFRDALPRKLAVEKLSRDGQIDLEIFRDHLSREIWLAENFRPFEDDPRIYGDYVSESVYLLLTQSSLPRVTNLANAVARMERVPGVIATARRTLTNPPKVKVETAIRQAEGAVRFYTTEIYRLAGEPPGQGRLGERANSIVAALRDYLTFLKQEVLPRASENWRIGRDRFVKKLEFELDADIPADVVLADAEREAERVEVEMGVIARQLWGALFPGTALPPEDREGRRLMIGRVLDALAANHAPADRLVAEAREAAAEIKDFIRAARILPLPEPDQCRIVEMPEFMRGNSLAYLNPAPPLDTRGSSEYSISPPPADWGKDLAESLLREYNSSMLRILTIHEAYPGHYVQLEYSNRCPSPIRKILASGTFSEGWAVYTEQMMLDQGYGRGDLALRLHQLKFYLRAVVNAILDHRLHAGGMTDREALELLVTRAFQTEGEAVAKLVRAKQTSCQLSTYFVGRMAFHRLRQSVQRELAGRFDLGRYHQAVLAHGTIPLKYLPELVRRTLELPPMADAATR